MPNHFHIDILSAQKTLYSAEAVSLVVPAEFGYLGVLANHAPLIAHLVKGKIIIRDDSSSAKTFDSSGGFIEVLKNKVTVILSA